MEILGLFIVAGLVIAGFASVESKISRTDRRAARIEQKLDLILDHLAIRQDDPQLEHVAALARDGKKIQAIKAYREATGVGLSEAEQAVERMN